MNRNDLREKMEDAINKVHADIVNPDYSSTQRANSANALSGLIRSYREMFGMEPEPGKLRSIKNY